MHTGLVVGEVFIYTDYFTYPCINGRCFERIITTCIFIENANQICVGACWSFMGTSVSLTIKSGHHDRAEKTAETFNQ